MGQQQSSTASELLLEDEPSSPFLTVGYRIALDQLRRAFAEFRPMAVLIGGWTTGASQLIRNFLAGIECDVVVLRVTAPGPDAIVGMRQIVQGIGCEPRELIPAALEKVFKDFITVQRAHHRRTIVIFEETQDNERWVLDRIRRFVELEMEGKFGLMVILSRRSELNGLINQTPLDAICAQAGPHISLAPFSVAETREYIRWRIEATPTADISRVFDFHAIALIHELCAGVPDAINSLCCKSIRLADEEDIAPVSTDLVMKASKLMQLPPIMQKSVDDARPVDVAPKLISDDDGRAPINIILTNNGETLSETTMERPQMTIGRSGDNDLSIDSKYISRHHAVLDLHGAEIFVTDLGSTNGTYVNFSRIEKPVAIRHDIISIGHYRIEIVNPNVHDRTAVNGSEFNQGAIMKGLANMRSVFARKGTEAQSVRRNFSISEADSDGGRS